MNRPLLGGSGKAVFLTIKFRYLFLLTLGLAGFFIFTSHRPMNVILFKEDKRMPVKLRQFASLKSALDDTHFTIHTEGCRIPALKPFDDSIKNAIGPATVEPCGNKSLALVKSDRDGIWIDYHVLPMYGVPAGTQFSCCYQSFYRPVAIEDITSMSVDDRATYSQCIYFNFFIRASDEFVRVTCSIKDTIIYEQYFVFAIQKNFTRHNDVEELTSASDGYNILVMGIDAVSRLNFHRTMPKTAKYLNEKGAIELLGYNKVGDNTFPNLMPMLLGYKDTELNKICMPYEYAKFDNCPFMWEWFKQAGYYTALGEDSSFLGTFNYVKAGFSNTPTDYYFHTFVHEAEHHVGKNKDFNSLLCMNDRYFYKVLLNYIENLTITLKDKKMFGFFWETTMSHDMLNYPMVMDDDYVDFFARIENYLNSTILFLVSDHGIRWGEIRKTKQGRLEERLPFVFVLVPPSFRHNYGSAYSNLKLNSGRLTTPFDIYATLSDLVNLTNIDNNKIQSRSELNYARDRSVSLFLPIPGNRTCEIANIDDHWCTCHKKVSLAKDSEGAVGAAENLVMLLNSMLKGHQQCAPLALHEIVDAMEFIVSHPSDGVKWWREFMVVVQTTPGDGVFEATLRYDGHQWALAGTPSRLNLYGEQSKCVDSALLKLYCYCNTT